MGARKKSSKEVKADGKLFSNGFMTINPEIMVAIAAKAPTNTVGFLLRFAIDRV